MRRRSISESTGFEWRLPRLLCAGKRALLLLLSVSVLVLGCGKSRERQKLDVYAASSLHDALESWARHFEEQHPEVDVRLTFAGSQILSLQIAQGARADVFASADVEHVATLRERELLDETHVLARSELVVVVPKNNREVEEFSDLVRAERVVLGTEAVPIGHYARQVLRATERETLGFSQEVRRHVVSYESNVRLIRAKVEMGEADAAFVYKSEAIGSPRLRIVTIPERFNVSAEYRIGVIARTQNRKHAESFSQSLLSVQGQNHLARFGFRHGGDG